MAETASDQTPLDRAHAAMEAAGDDTAARMQFYGQLAGAELFLMLESEADGDQVTPQVFELETGPVVVAFDREDRLAGFAGGITPFASMSGRTLVPLLADQGLGLGLNLEVAPSAILLPADALRWFRDNLDGDLQEGEARPSEVRAPIGLPEALLTGLDAKLAGAAGLAAIAYLVGVTYADGRASHLLAFIDPVPGAEGALAQVTQEALTFSGIEAGSLDVAFFPASDGIAPQLAKVGLRFDLPKLADPSAPKPPGMDPDAPPRLR